ncbi:aldehyde dehydrogenase-like protein [Physcia stellaris]|nr:aldehyde dehydrogenase-like protein [Physcia stellaris]
MGAVVSCHPSSRHLISPSTSTIPYSPSPPPQNPSLTPTPNQIKSIFQTIGACLMAIVNGIGSVLQAIIAGIVSLFDIIISCLTCGRGGAVVAGGEAPSSLSSPVCPSLSRHKGMVFVHLMRGEWCLVLELTMGERES